MSALANGSGAERLLEAADRNADGLSGDFPGPIAGMRKVFLREAITTLIVILCGKDRILQSGLIVDRTGALTQADYLRERTIIKPGLGILPSRPSSLSLSLSLSLCEVLRFCLHAKPNS